LKCRHSFLESWFCRMLFSVEGEDFPAALRRFYHVTSWQRAVIRRPCGAVEAGSDLRHPSNKELELHIGPSFQRGCESMAQPTRVHSTSDNFRGAGADEESPISRAFSASRETPSSSAKQDHGKREEQRPVRSAMFTFSRRPAAPSGFKVTETLLDCMRSR